MEEGRNCRSFIDALLHCGLNLQQMGQDTLANVQCEPADLHRASLFKHSDAGTGKGTQCSGHPEMRFQQFLRLRVNPYA